jgi:acyl carrier protein
MNREDAIQVVFEVLEKNAEDLEMSIDRIDVTLSDLGIDSLDTMLVIMDIAEATGVAISDDQAEVLDTPRKIIDFVSND